jgi:hypothetical protein
MAFVNRGAPLSFEDIGHYARVPSLTGCGRVVGKTRN